MRILLLFLSACLVVAGNQAAAQVQNRSGKDSTLFISGVVFVPRFAFESGEQNWAVEKTDFNHDGFPDLITASRADGMVNVHLNDGKGNFLQKSSFPSQPQNRALAVLDANGDGEPDVVTVTALGKLCVLINDRQGKLLLTQNLFTGVMAHDVEAADLNNDGKPDLIVAVVNDNALKVHLNNGHGQFGSAVSIPTGRGPRAVEVGDVNNDGMPDLVVGCDDGRIYLHLGKSPGNFATPVSIRSTTATWALRLADLNGDGALDIAAASYLDTNLFIHLNKGDGTFLREQEVASGDHNFDLEIADFDLDGDLDIVTCSTLDNAIHYHLNDGHGIFGPGNEMKSGDWNAALVVADFDGDSDPDVAVASINDRSVNIHRNISWQPKPVAKRLIALTGVVYHGETNHPVSKAPVSLLDNQGNSIATVVTDASGKFSFKPAVNRDYVLQVRSVGYPVARESVHMPDSSIQQDLYLFRPKGAFVYGRVYDQATGKSILGADVVIRTKADEVVTSLVTGEEGDYKTPLPFGNYYNVEALAPGYQSGNRYFDLEEKHIASGQKVDIPLVKAPQTDCMKGIVLDATTLQPVTYARLEFRLLTEKEHKSTQANEDGHFRACFPFGEYEISTTAQGYFFKIDTLNHHAGTGDDQTIIYLTPLAIDLKMVLKNIYYDVDKATLRTESIAELDRLLRMMQDNPSLKVEIAGHTDSDGSDEHNESLSKARAQSVVSYLSSHGIEFSRLVSQGYGESQPVAGNDNPANKQMNRRTEFKVLGY